MCNWLIKSIAIVSAGLMGAAVGFAAPRPADREGEREKAVKAAVAEFVAAMSQQNVDAFVEACGVPFSHEPGKLARDAATLRKMYKVEVEGRPPFDAHVVKRVETYKEAKARLGEGGVKGFDEILRDKDSVATVVLQRRGRKYPSRLLLKVEDGKAKVVGWRSSSGD